MIKTQKSKDAHEAARQAVQPTLNKVGVNEVTLHQQLQDHIDAMGKIEDPAELAGYARCLRTVAESPLVARPTRIIIGEIADKYLAAYCDEMDAKAASGKIHRR